MKLLSTLLSSAALLLLSTCEYAAEGKKTAASKFRGSSFFSPTSKPVSSSSGNSPYAIAYEMADLCDKAYGSLGIYAGFFFIPNNAVELKGTTYKLRSIYNINSDYAFTAQKDGVCVVAFRGSDNLKPDDWVSNFEANGVPFHKLGAASTNNASVFAYVHEGDLQGYQKFSLNETNGFLRDVGDCLARSPTTKLYLTGHSRGGAMASIMAMQVALDEGLDKYGDFSRMRAPLSQYLSVYTIGENRNLIDKEPPQASPTRLAAITNGIVKYRFINKRDIVPSIPTFSFNNKTLGADFVHFGTPLHHSGGNKIEAVPIDFPTHLNETLNLVDHIPSSYIEFLAANA